MSTISRADVAHLAMLARIDLSEAELDTMAGELAAVLGAFARVGEGVGDDVPGMSHPVPLSNVMRADAPADPAASQRLDAGQALSGAPETEDGRFVVPRILAED